MCIRDRRHAGAHDFRHHADGERAGANGRIANGDVAQERINLACELADGVGRFGIVVAARPGGDGGGVVGELVALPNPEFQILPGDEDALPGVGELLLRGPGLGLFR